MHLGHYKALVARHSYLTTTPDEDLPIEFRTRRDELDARQQALRRRHLILIDYALERGYSYQRWQRVDNTILFIVKDNVRLHQTQVIHTYEADQSTSWGEMESSNASGRGSSTFERRPTIVRLTPKP